MHPDLQTVVVSMLACHRIFNKSSRDFQHIRSFAVLYSCLHHRVLHINAGWGGKSGTYIISCWGRNTTGMQPMMMESMTPLREMVAPGACTQKVELR